MAQTDGVIVANPPNDQIYDFKGYFESSELAKKSPARDSENMSPDKSQELLDGALSTQKESLSLENTLRANTVLASSGHIFAMVVFTGKETRA